jgi:hypothetical protein
MYTVNHIIRHPEEIASIQQKKFGTRTAMSSMDKRIKATGKETLLSPPPVAFVMII